MCKKGECIMNNMGFKKKIANKVVNTAIRSAKLSNQKCLFLMGKPNEKVHLCVGDYEKLKIFINQY
jgi:hypothetical protein